MKMKIYMNIFRCALITLATLCLHSCIKDDDMSKCPDTDNVRIVVEIDADYAGASRGTGYNIENSILYVFDSERRFVTYREGGRYVDGETYEFILTLEEGRYHFILWTNLGDMWYNTNIATAAMNRHQIEELQLHLTTPGTVITEDVPDMFHGLIANADVTEVEDHVFNMFITPNNTIINVSVSGLEPDADEYAFSVTDDNINYNFENSFASSEAVKYSRLSQFKDDGLNASVMTLRIADGRSPEFVFENATTSSVYIRDNLVSMIKQAYAASGQTPDFDKTRVFDLELVFDETGMLVIVSVNGWNYNYNDTPISN